MTMTRKHLKKPSQIPTWSPNGVNGWYLGPEPLHYICHTTYVTEKIEKRISYIENFLPSRIEMPITNSVDQIFQDEKYLTTALIEHPKPRTPYLEFGDATLNALKN